MSPKPQGAMATDGMMRRRRQGQQLQHGIPDGDDHGDQDPDGEEIRGPEQLQLIGQEIVVAEGVTSEVDPAYTTPTKSTMATPSAAPLALQDMQEHAAGEPVSYKPPLFDEQQLAKMEELQSRSPLLPFHEARTMDASGSVMGNGKGDGNGSGKGKGEKPKTVPKDLNSENTQYYNLASRSSTEADEQEIMWRWQVGKELRELGLLLRASQAENQKLKEELDYVKAEALEGRFQTPEDDEEPQKPLPDGGLPDDGRPLRVDQGKTSHADPALGGGGGLDREDRKMELMMLMLQGMQEMQKQFISKDGDGLVGGVEVVRNGTAELPLLAEWDPVDAPLKMGDWMALMEPVISDLTATSELWWKEMVAHVQDWYQRHLRLAPLQRASHDPVPPPALQRPQWQRLEKRVASMLLRSIPEQQREELVAAKRLTVYGMLCHLQKIYQPGGLGEKQTLIRNLEEPPEAQSLGEAVQGLRRWLRWRQRASELQACEPDPSVMVRSLTKITSRVLEVHKDLSFRIALARSTLLVDTSPTKEVVSQYAMHLLAEIEQVSHVEKKIASNKVVNTKAENPKIRRLEEETKGLGKGGDRKIQEFKKDNEEKKPPCRFYMSDDGCKKGKSCRWQHVLDESLGSKRRCWTCGSTRHFSSSCPTSSGTTSSTSTSATESPPKVKVAKEEVESQGKSEKVEENVSPVKDEKSEDQMKTLIEEANRMLKSLNRRAEPQHSAQPSLEDLQKQLDSLRGGPRSLRALRLTKMSTRSQEQWALLDSGATHPLRPLEPGDNLEDFDKVWVTLADGHRVPMLMSSSGVMVSVDQAVEPIVPLGWLAEAGCVVEWKAKGLQVIHPKRGKMEVQVRSGCPQIDRQLALELIKEYEIGEVQKMVRKLQSGEGHQASPEEEVQWLRDLCRLHPVLSELPEHIKEALVCTPGQWQDLPINRHKRKKLKQGYVLHLYSGEKEGFTLEKALKEQMYGNHILEVDIKHGQDSDMTGDSRVYKGLLRSAMDGSMWGLIGGPNCRSRSVLRHYPGGPRPVREWNGGEFGRADATAAETKLTQQDDIMLWRMVFLALVSDFVLKANGGGRRIVFGLEQPAEPDYMPQVVSFWWTKEWKQLRDLMGWHEIKFNQGDFVEQPTEVPVKPTKFGGNLELEVPLKSNPLAKAREEGGALDSRSLSRWVPELMRSVARALVVQVFNKELKVPALRALTWEQHVEAGHVPFRRDCRICQESSAKSKPHRRVHHPLAGTLSVDTAGPFKEAEEEDGSLWWGPLLG